VALVWYAFENLALVLGAAIGGHLAARRTEAKLRERTPVGGYPLAPSGYPLATSTDRDQVLARR
jgi:hypothetical protein